jgi:uncharacterized membrane protein YphA (DoxX/SURF4 family)
MASGGKNGRGPALAGLVARSVLGLATLLHAARELGAFDGPGIVRLAGALSDRGLAPAEPIAWIVVVARLLAGAALLIGAFPRTAAATAAAGALVAMTLYHNAAWFQHAGGIEYPLALCALALCVWVHGPGAAAWGVSFRRQKAGGERR